MNIRQPTTGYRADMDTATTAALIAGGVAVVTALVSGFWPWFTGRRKVELDAQGTVITGFISLLAEFRTELEALRKRLDECEAIGLRQDRRMAKLEHRLIQAGIELPSEEI